MAVAKGNDGLLASKHPPGDSSLYSSDMLTR